jgi:general secretion pathway protein B
MSFILDALKKSEHERQRQSMPGLVESGIVRPRPRMAGWAIAACILLGINLIVLLVVLTRGAAERPTPEVAPQAAGPPTAAPSVAKPAPDAHFSPLDASPVYAPEVPVNSAPVVSPAASPAPWAAPRTPSTATADSPAVHARHRDPLLNDSDYKADEEEVLPSINELNLTGADALPELHLDVHVFATNSAERFVFINMRKYHEGATLQEGPTVERIRRDGVILDYRGLRFLLPRE